MSQVSGDEGVGEAPVVDRLVEVVECGSEPGGGRGGVRHDLGQAWAEEAGVGPGEEERGAESVPGETVAVGARDPLDQAMQAETAQVVGHPARGEMAGG